MKRYRVTGGTRTLGHEPGSVFQAAIPSEQEQRLLQRGSIERAPKDRQGENRAATGSHLRDTATRR